MASPALAQEPAGVDACLTAHEAGQVARRDGKLLEARERFAECAAAGCPEMLQGDCTTWGEELTAEIPTVVFTVIDEATGRVLKDVTVFDGDRELKRGSAGQVVPLDPGEHRFRFVTPRGGEASETVQLAPRAQNQQVVVRLTEPVAEAPAPATPEAPAPDVGDGGLPTAAWILGGVGIAGLATFAIVGAVGLSKESDLEETCAPSCPSGDVDEVRRLYLAADVMGVLGIAALTGAVVVAFTLGNDDGDLALQVSPTGLSLGGRF